jgi:hypothetical protein
MLVIKLLGKGSLTDPVTQGAVPEIWTSGPKKNPSLAVDQALPRWVQAVNLCAHPKKVDSVGRRNAL